MWTAALQYVELMFRAVLSILCKAKRSGPPGHIGGFDTVYF